MVRMRWVLVPIVLAGCAYKAGSVARPDETGAGDQATIDCLQVSVDRRMDRGASPVLAYSFGNRCARPIAVDVAWAAVIGRTAGGAEVALAPRDPEAQLGVIELAARTTSYETITYPADDALGQVCVDVASLAQQAPAQWLCFGNRDSIAMLDR